MRYVYFAPNEQEQEQRKGVKEYLSLRQVYMGDCNTLLSDYEYGDTKYDSGIKYMLTSLKEGDVLYVWDLSALGKSLTNLYTNLLFSNTRGIIIVQCIDGEVLSPDTEETNALLRGIGIASRIDFSFKQSSTKKGLDAKRKQLEENGGFYNKRGEWVTRLGPPLGREISDTQKEAIRSAHRLNRNTWRAASVGYQWVIEQLKAGVPRREIVAEFNKRHETNPNDYSTRHGGTLCEGTLSRWAKELLEESANND